MSKRIRTVFIEGLELMSSVGVYEHERRDRQPVIVSMALDVADSYEGGSDKLNEVYDYDIAITAIREIVAAEHYNLIETLAERLAERVLGDARVERVKIRIEKPAVLTACRSLGIEIVRTRGDFQVSPSIAAPSS